MPTRKYLEISSIGAACKKMRFEPPEKVLLHSWARHSPDYCRDFLIKNGYITSDNKATETLKDHSTIIESVAENISASNTKTSDFKKIIDHAEDNLKKLRKEQGIDLTEKEIATFRETSQSYVKTTFGKNSEHIVTSNISATAGNDKMYYFNLNSNWCFGGKHDACKGDLVIEIKTRVKKENVRKNEYDLYQLVAYLMAMGKTRGKIVQMHNNVTYDSDVETENEYGIIDIQHYKHVVEDILNELSKFFTKLEKVIEDKAMSNEDIQIAIPSGEKPICTLANGLFVNKNSKYFKLFYHVKPDQRVLE
jgi:CRISPR/Cas system-associated exonuclease Cas4 (RecB family)